MKKLVVFCFLLISVVAFGQPYKTHYELNTPMITTDEDGTLADKNYRAANYIKLLPGFRGIPLHDKHFNLKIEDNKRLFSEPTYNTYIHPNTRELDKSLPVGSLPATFTVSSSGASIYNMPISIPAGINGIEPKLSITYNSQGSNSILGYGFSLSGLSKISKSRKSLYYDGVRENPKLSRYNPIQLNGQRLIKIYDGGTNNLNSVYATEQENYLRVVNKGYAYEATTKEGLKMTYGLYSSMANIIFPDIRQALSSFLNKVEDAYGNYYEINYIVISDNEILPKEIVYTKNDSESNIKTNKIVFEYMDRYDKTIKYFDGFKISSSKLLHAIKIYQENKVVRKYLLKYFFDGYSKLNEIVLIGSKGEKLNSTVIGWNMFKTNHDYNVKQYVFAKNEKSTVTFGDFDGSGTADIIRIPVKEEYSSNDNWEVYLNSIQSEQEIGKSNFFLDADATGSLKNHFQEFLNTQTYNGSFHPDFNGDGLSDILLMEKSKRVVNQEYIEVKHTYTPILSNISPTKEIFFNESSSYQSFEESYIEQPYGSSSGVSPEIKTISVLPGKFNNSANNNLLFFSRSSTTRETSVYLNYWNSNGENVKTDDYNLGEGIRYFNVGDFNGDGNTDFIIYNYLSNVLKVYQYLNSQVQLLFTHALPSRHQEFSLGDFNGDGITDILAIRGNDDLNNSSIYWAKYPSVGFSGLKTKTYDNCTTTFLVSTGRSLQEYNILPNLFSHSFPKRILPDFFHIIDLNGDGRSDIIEQIPYQGREGQDSVSLNPPPIKQTRVHLNFPTGYEMIEKDDLPVLSKKQSTFSDFDGDGRIDVMFRDHYNDLNWDILFFRTEEYEHLATTFLNGFNNKISVDYKPITNNSVYPSFTSTSSLVASRFPLLVTKSVRSSIFDDVTPWKEFYYSNARVHRNGKGFLGFQGFSEKNNATGIIKSSFNKYDDDLYFLYPSTQNTVLEKNGIVIPITENQYFKYAKTVLANDKRFTNNLLESLSYNHLNGVNLKTSYEYDIENNVTKTRIQNNSGTYYDEKTVNQYLKTTGNFLTSPDIVTTEKFIAGSDGAFTTTIDNNYEVSSKRITKLTQISSDGVTTITDLNSVGNPYKVTTIPADNELPTKINEAFYDATNRFVVRRKNTIGDEITSSYDPALGSVLSETSANGLTTTHKYDGFGKRTSTTTPNGNKIYYKTEWDDTNTGLYYTLTETEGQPYSKTYFDSFGRKIKSETVRADGEKVFVDYEYNNKGQLWRSTLPYTAIQTKKWQTTTYDDYGRVINESDELTGVTITRDYGNVGDNEVTTSSSVTDYPSVTSKYNDVGMVTSVTEEESTVPNITYKYHSSGQPQNITAAGNTTSMSYDPATGAQKTLTDPNAGTFTYDYNDYGQLGSQTDAENNVYEIKYDDIGRIESKKDLSGEEDEVTYTYFNSGVSKGKIKEVKMAEVVKKSFTYDDLGRTATTTDHINATHIYTTAYEYNQLGQLKTYTYPSGYQLQYTYNEYGANTEIKGGKDGEFKIIWSVNEANYLNQDGQIKEYFYGEGENIILNTIEYDEYSFPTNFKATKNSTGTVLFDYGFGFDKETGNLQYREDKINNQEERFEYDKYDRLLKVYPSKNQQVSASLNMVYADNGNITTKSDIGVYNYNGIPHAPSSVDGNLANEISEKIQNITYTNFDKTEHIDEGNYAVDITYGPEEYRREARYENPGNLNEYTKYYSGQYEVKEFDNGKIEKLHYISTPTGLSAIYVEDKDGNGKLYYIKQDHLGSLVAVINEDGTVQERLSYDAWGRRRRADNWQDYQLDFTDGQLYIKYIPTFDRGYTGHEHLDDFGLINMNGRLYDPFLGQMLSPDNYVQNPLYAQNYNRYAYAYNNPLKYTDPDGEIAFLAVAGIYAGINLTADLIRNDFKMNIGEIGLSLGKGALNGALAAFSGGVTNGWMALGGAISGQFPSAGIGFTAGNFSIGLTPSILIGNGFGVGANISASYQIGDFSISAGYGGSYMGKSLGSGGKGFEGRTSFGANYDDGIFGIGLYSTIFNSKGTSQRVGGLYLRHGDWSARYENDGFPFDKIALGDGNDSYRTAAVQISYLDYSVGFKLFTGRRTQEEFDYEQEMYGGICGPSCIGQYGEKYPSNWTSEVGPRYRLGALYAGYQGYQVGVNSEWIRHGIQNRWAHGKLAKKQPGFEMLSNDWKFYYNYQTLNPFTLW